MGGGVKPVYGGLGELDNSALEVRFSISGRNFILNHALEFGVILQKFAVKLLKF